MPLVAARPHLDRVGHLPLLDDASLQIEPRERVCVIGRNGTGKSTLLQIISGELPPDAGSVWRQPGLRIGRLEQDVPLDDRRPVFERRGRRPQRISGTSTSGGSEQHVDVDALAARASAGRDR